MSRIRIRGFQSVGRNFVAWGKDLEGLEAGNNADNNIKLEGLLANGHNHSGPVYAEEVNVIPNGRRMFVRFPSLYLPGADGKKIDLETPPPELDELEVTVTNNGQTDSTTNDA